MTRVVRPLLGFFFVLVAIFVAAIFAPLIAPADPYASSILNRLKPIGTPGHLLGTDEHGSRAPGARVSGILMPPAAIPDLLGPGRPAGGPAQRRTD